MRKSSAVFFLWTLLLLLFFFETQLSAYPQVNRDVSVIVGWMWMFESLVFIRQDFCFCLATCSRSALLNSFVCLWISVSAGVQEAGVFWCPGDIQALGQRGGCAGVSFHVHSLCVPSWVCRHTWASAPLCPDLLTCMCPEDVFACVSVTDAAYFSLVSNQFLVLPRSSLLSLLT